MTKNLHINILLLILFNVSLLFLSAHSENICSVLHLDNDIATGASGIATFKPYHEPPSLRHRQEKERLFISLNYETGDWGVSHPRHKLLQALHGLYRYEYGCLADLEQWKTTYDGISAEQKKVICEATSHEKRFELFRENQIRNQAIIKRVLANAMRFYEISMEELNWFITEEEDGEILFNPYGVSDILNHLVRDWSSGGPHKRDLGSEPILETLSALYPDREPHVKPKRILVPGAGVGRLAHEIAHLDAFEVTMNEISADMNIFYRYAETLRVPETATIHPHIDWRSYQPSMEELAREIMFPDVPIDASDVLLVEGDFVSVFENSTGQFDTIVTLFFFDTAQNLLDYLDVIHRLLRPGGVWINLGSFLYGASPFLHLSLEDFVAVSKNMGFEFVPTDEKWGDLSIPGETLRTREVSYLFNERAYRKKLYEAQFWVARKW
ncbi:N2227-domain-containing protein [Tothia fuscella]|uniref:N2227-domain-containing protein n=1 Tax=Tothia fuscella TaxID=1048955 RepID=A0A9P4TSF3_9PEZI|nr:N2227-domain-containing protein [Tothia fuscella]